MSDTSRKPNLLAISGSLRRGSFNTAVLEALREAAADRANITLHPLDAVPLYNQDADVDPRPPGVVALQEAVGTADGVIIASPEYNYGMPGVLKNALDWVSRPYGKSRLIGKPVLTLTVSPASTGGVRAQAQLNDVLLSMAALLVLRPQAVVGGVHNKMRDGRFEDADTMKFLLAGVDDLVRDIRRTQSAITQES